VCVCVCVSERAIFSLFVVFKTYSLLSCNFSLFAPLRFPSSPPANPHTIHSFLSPPSSFSYFFLVVFTLLLSHSRELTKGCLFSLADHVVHVLGRRIVTARHTTLIVVRVMGDHRPVHAECTECRAVAEILDQNQTNQEISNTIQKQQQKHQQVRKLADILRW
jgi:hypothetical protein